MNIETIKIIWIYLNNYNFTITKISNVFCGFVFFSFEIFAVQLKFKLWFYNLMTSYFRRFFRRYSFLKSVFDKKLGFQKVFHISNRSLLPWNDHKILMWLKVTLSDVIVQFCHSFCHSWREIKIFISDVLHVT